MKKICKLLLVAATLPVITSAGFTDGLYELVTRNA